MDKKAKKCALIFCVLVSLLLGATLCSILLIQIAPSALTPGRQNRNVGANVPNSMQNVLPNSMQNVLPNSMQNVLPNSMQNVLPNSMQEDTEAWQFEISSGSEVTSGGDNGGSRPQTPVTINLSRKQSPTPSIVLRTRPDFNELRFRPLQQQLNDLWVANEMDDLTLLDRHKRLGKQNLPEVSHDSHRTRRQQKTRRIKALIDKKRRISQSVSRKDQFDNLNKPEARATDALDTGVEEPEMQISEFRDSSPPNDRAHALNGFLKIFNSVRKDRLVRDHVHSKLNNKIRKMSIKLKSNRISSSKSSKIIRVASEKKEENKLGFSSSLHAEINAQKIGGPESGARQDDSRRRTPYDQALILANSSDNFEQASLVRVLNSGTNDILHLTKLNPSASTMTDAMPEFDAMKQGRVRLKNSGTQSKRNDNPETKRQKRKKLRRKRLPRTYGSAAIGIQALKSSTLPDVQSTEPCTTPGIQTKEPCTIPGSLTTEPGSTLGIKTTEPGSTLGFVTIEPGITPGIQRVEPGTTPGLKIREPGSIPGLKTREPGSTLGIQSTIGPGLRSLVGSAGSPGDGACWTHDQCGERRLCFDGWCIRQRPDSEVRNAGSPTAELRQEHHGDLMNLNPLISRDPTRPKSVLTTNANNAKIVRKRIASKPNNPQETLKHGYNDVLTESEYQGLNSHVKNNNEDETSLGQVPDESKHKHKADLMKDSSELEGNDEILHPEDLSDSESKHKRLNTLDDPEKRFATKDALMPTRDKRRLRMSSESVLVGIAMTVSVLLVLMLVTACVCCCYYRQQNLNEEEQELILKPSLTNSMGEERCSHNNDSGGVRSRPPSYRSLAPPDYVQTRALMGDGPLSPSRSMRGRGIHAGMEAQSRGRKLEANGKRPSKHVTIEEINPFIRNEQIKTDAIHDRVENQSTKPDEKFAEDIHLVDPSARQDDNPGVQQMLKESNVTPEISSEKITKDIKTNKLESEDSGIIDGNEMRRNGQSDNSRESKVNRDIVKELAEILVSRRESCRKAGGVQTKVTAQLAYRGMEPKAKAATDAAHMTEENKLSQEETVYVSTDDSFSSYENDEMQARTDERQGKEIMPTEHIYEEVEEQRSHDSDVLGQESEPSAPLYENLPRQNS
ncbi:uncharacterized protein LOC108678189 [Hyalella azteca]|uniref:Uncharacterized protein LOC108678189 n=1 Tax=Hyalella azteca TaxID=294128 RepID=A0A8B7P894_HYAAZ|nr:uncharacterized protein LOC108678189 [Hyalella azteca]